VPSRHMTRGPAVAGPRNEFAVASVKRVFEALYLLFGFFLRDPVTLLNRADQLVALTGDFRELVVRELAPRLANFAGHLLPVALDLIPIHLLAPCSVWPADARERKLRGTPWRGNASPRSAVPSNAAAWEPKGSAHQWPPPPRSTKSFTR